MERTYRWGAWDTNRNSMLEENEFGESAFGLWDDNNDAMLDNNEWSSEAGF